MYVKTNLVRETKKTNGLEEEFEKLKQKQNSKKTQENRTQFKSTKWLQDT